MPRRETWDNFASLPMSLYVKISVTGPAWKTFISFSQQGNSQPQHSCYFPPILLQFHLLMFLFRFLLLTLYCVPWCFYLYHLILNVNGDLGYIWNYLFKNDKMYYTLTHLLLITLCSWTYIRHYKYPSCLLLFRVFFSWDPKLR